MRLNRLIAAGGSDEGAACHGPGRTCPQALRNVDIEGIDHGALRSGAAGTGRSQPSLLDFHAPDEVVEKCVDVANLSLRQNPPLRVADDLVHRHFD